MNEPKSYLIEIVGQMPDAIYELALQEIVRCRDCIWYDPDYYLGKWCTNLGFSLQEQTDGFCAWGERKSE